MANFPKHFLIFLLSVWYSCAVFDGLHSQEISEFESMPIDTVIHWLEHNITNDSILFIEIAELASRNSGNNPKTLGEIYTHLASWYGYHGLYHQDSTLKYSEKSVEQFKKAGDREALAGAYRTLAIDYVNNGRLEESNVVLFKAVDIYEELGDEVGLANINRTIGIVASFEANYERAIEYGLKAYPIFEREKDFYKMAVTQLNLIQPYRETNQLDKSHETATLCIDIVNNWDPEQYGILARAYANKAETSHLEGKYEQALIEAQKSFEIASGAVGRERAASYLAGVANAQMALGDIQNAAENYEFILDNESDVENYMMKPLYENVIQCYEKLSDYPAVAKYQKVLQRIETTFYEDKVKNLEAESFAKYESGKKDQAILDQQRELKQKSRIQLLSYGIGALLLIFLVGLYLNYRRVQKISKQLKIKNNENELLLKEIHHRVKNNLEIVSGLLELQSAQIDDESIQKAMLDSQNRVQAMGILHQKLYQGVKLDTIDMKDYFLNLSEGVLDTFNADQKVTIELAVQNLELDVDTAVPVGLIVNELLTNALKYAFPDEGTGQIKIALQEIEDDYLQLQVKDSGIGMSTEAQPKGTGFGTQLISLLTKQLNGNLTRDFAEGTVITLKFKRSKAA